MITTNSANWQMNVLAVQNNIESLYCLLVGWLVGLSVLLKKGLILPLGSGWEEFYPEYLSSEEGAKFFT